MPKQDVRIFISYAHRNQTALGFMEDFEEYCHCSKTYRYDFWRDTALLPGVKWDEEIRRNLERSDCGLLLVSPAFLSSRYIRDVEIPALIKPGKILLPVGFAEVNFQCHDLHGLEERQIFRYTRNRQAPKFYTDLSGKGKAGFISDLFSQMEERLDRDFKP